MPGVFSLVFLLWFIILNIKFEKVCEVLKYLFYQSPAGTENPTSPNADVDTSGPKGGHADHQMTCMAATVAAPSHGSASGEEQGEKSLNSRILETQNCFSKSQPCSFTFLK